MKIPTAPRAVFAILENNASPDADDRTVGGKGVKQRPLSVCTLEIEMAYIHVDTFSNRKDNSFF